MNLKHYQQNISCERTVCPTILLIAGGRIIGFIPFPRVSVLCEMQSASSRIWIYLSYWPSLMVHPSWEPWHLLSHSQPCCVLLWKHTKKKIKGTGRGTLCHQALTILSAATVSCLFHIGFICQECTCSRHGPAPSWSSFLKPKPWW